MLWSNTNLTNTWQIYNTIYIDALITNQVLPPVNIRTSTRNVFALAQPQQSSHFPHVPPVCGLAQPLKSGQRVLQGKEARAGEFPWQVLLLVPGRGGAAVIAPDWVMTAAHNLESKTADQIKVVSRHVQRGVFGDCRPRPYASSCLK